MVRAVVRVCLLFTCIVGFARSASAQIAFDAQSVGSLSFGGSPSWSHTMGSGSGGLLVVGDFGSSSSGIAGVTWNGNQSFTHVVCHPTVPSDREIELWYLLAPTSGTHTIVADCTNVDACQPAAVSYTGVGSYDTCTSAVRSVSGGTEISIDNIISVGTNAWIVTLAKGPATPTWTNLTGRTTTYAGDDYMADSNGPLTGTQTVTANWGVTGSPSAMVSASFLPSGGTTPTCGAALLLRNVGCGD